MSEGGRALRQALVIGALAVLVAAAVRLPLIKRFGQGQFRDSFFQASDYPGVRLITLEEAEDLWRTAGAVFVDARKTPAFEDGHVPGARSWPASEADRDVPAAVLDLPRDGTLAVYCEGGDCQSSLLLAKRLDGEGFKDVRVMTGGWAAWTSAGLPEEKSAPEERTQQRKGEKGDGQK